MFEMLKWVFSRLPAECRVYFREVYAAEAGGFEDIDLALQIEAASERVIASISVILPKDKQRSAARERFLARYRDSLQSGAHLMVIDALSQPNGVSFADEIATDFGLHQPTVVPPFVACYRSGAGAVAVSSWRLGVGQPLPTVALGLDAERSIPIDLEHTYTQAARRVYLT